MDHRWTLMIARFVSCMHCGYDYYSNYSVLDTRYCPPCGPGTYTSEATLHFEKSHRSGALF
jgi:hypothetical protein